MKTMYAFGSDSHPPRYPELLAEARRILGGLRAHGAAPGRTVALLLERPSEFLPALWACLLGGMAVCPMVAIRNGPQRWATYLAHVGSLLEEPLLVNTEQLRAELPDVSGLEVVSLEDLTDVVAGTSPTDVRIHQVEAADIALLVLTSGSTGNSKAAMLTYGNLLASMKAKTEVQNMTSEDITLNWISYDHVAALLEAHLLPLSVGATQLHTSPEEILGDPLRFLQLINTHRVTMTFTPNFLLGLIDRALLSLPAGLPWDLSSLQRIISGGEANLVSTGVAFENLASCGLDRGVLWPSIDHRHAWTTHAEGSPCRGDGDVS